MVDTSALMAVVLGEPPAADCREVLARQQKVLISATTLAEALIVAERRNVGAVMTRLLDDTPLEVAPVTAISARGVAAAYARWGKGVDRAKLNLADCFAYELAVSRRAPLLYVGRDFAQTDVESAISLAERQSPI